MSLLTYEQWDFIADAYIPLLVLSVCLSTAVCRSRVGLIPLSINIVFVYAVYGLDKLVGLWPSVGLDYSTHTAVSQVLVVCLVMLHRGKLAVMMLSVGSFLLYLWLMHYQQYHTYLDMITTVLVVSLGIWASVRLERVMTYRKRLKAQKSKEEG